MFVDIVCFFTLFVLDESFPNIRNPVASLTQMCQDHRKVNIWAEYLPHFDDNSFDIKEFIENFILSTVGEL